MAENCERDMIKNYEGNKQLDERKQLQLYQLQQRRVRGVGQLNMAIAFAIMYRCMSWTGESKQFTVVITPSLAGITVSTKLSSSSPQLPLSLLLLVSLGPQALTQAGHSCHYPFSCWYHWVHKPQPKQFTVAIIPSLAGFTGSTNLSSSRGEWDGGGYQTFFVFARYQDTRLNCL